MLVVPDAEEPYCPLPQSVLGPLKGCRALAEALLDQLPRIYAGTNHLDGCTTAAIEACILALKVTHFAPQPSAERRPLLLSTAHRPVLCRRAKSLCCSSPRVEAIPT